MGKKKKPQVVPLEAKPEVKRTVSSPVYPAVVLPAPEAAAAPKAPTKTAWKAKGFTLTLQVAVVAVPAVISGFFSYKSAKVDSEVGYQTVALAVDELQEAVKELVRQQAYMQGELDAQRSDAVKLHGLKLGARPPAPPKAEVTLSTLPEDLGQAVSKRNFPMRQQVLTFAPPSPAIEFSPKEKAILEGAVRERAAALEVMKANREAAKAQDAVTPVPPPDQSGLAP
jgi:hypothetical protein